MLFNSDKKASIVVSCGTVVVDACVIVDAAPDIGLLWGGAGWCKAVVSVG